MQFVLLVCRAAALQLGQVLPIGYDNPVKTGKVGRVYLARAQGSQVVTGLSGAGDGARVGRFPYVVSVCASRVQRHPSAQATGVRLGAGNGFGGG